QITVERHAIVGRCKITASTGESQETIDVGLLSQKFRLRARLYQNKVFAKSASRSLAAQGLTSTVFGNRDVSAATVEVLEFKRNQTSSVDAERFDLSEQETVEIGKELFSFIFRFRTLELYRDMLRAARENDAPFVIRLCVKHPDLSYIPWE